LAEKDRSDHTSPERLLARTLLDELGLSPPVDVAHAAAQFMDIEEDVIAADCDAVILGLAGDDGERPRIILNADRPSTRQRFTLAHELGHFRIPWHLGTIVCHTDLHGSEHEEWNEIGDDDLLHWATESEANTFASEFLIPQTWLSELFDRETSQAKAITRVHEADVSPAAACYALSEFLPPGHVLAVLEPLRIARYLFRTVGTNVNLAQRGERVDTTSLDQLSSSHAVIPWGSQLVHWWYFENEAPLVESDDERSPTQLLRGMLADLIGDEDERDKIFRSIQAVSGYTKNVAPDHAPETLHGVLRQRFTERPWLTGLLGHKDFGLWLSRRAEQLSRPRGRK
jgi:hypothetical protein